MHLFHLPPLINFNCNNLRTSFQKKVFIEYISLLVIIYKMLLLIIVIEGLKKNKKKVIIQKIADSEKMIKSKTELSLQEMNEQIHMIVKGDEQNATSYFPNAEMVLEAFENYLQCSEILDGANRCKFNSTTRFSIFQESISSTTLLKYHHFLNLLLNWQFPFTTLLNKLFSNQILEFNNQNHYLHEINLTEIIFVMYLCLEIQRKEIIGKLQYEKSNNMFLLKEIVKLLDEVYVNKRGKCYGKGQARRKDNSFSIHQDKLVKVLLLKALKIKLERENFSFKLDSGLKSVQIQQQQKIKPIQNKMRSSADVSFSLISIQSQYNNSEINQQMPQTLKESLNIISSKLNQSHFELERRNLSNQEIFKYISLNQSKGYIGK